MQERLEGLRNGELKNDRRFLRGVLAAGLVIAVGVGQPDPVVSLDSKKRAAPESFWKSIGRCSGRKPAMTAVVDVGEDS